jgi:ribonuclease P protein component
MLAYKYRFHGHGSLRYVFRNGNTARNRAVLLRYTHNERRKYSRLAVVVGKKVSKSAVTRNRIRRRVFELFRKHWSHLAPQTDMVLTVFTAEAAVMPSTELEDMLLEVLRQAGIYRSDAVSDILE